MRCRTPHIVRRAALPVGGQGEGATEDLGLTGVQVWFLTGSDTPPPISLPTPGPFFAATIGHFTESLLAPLRANPDPVALWGPPAGSPAANGVATLERRWISPRLKAGSNFFAPSTRFTSVILAGNAAPSNSCLPIVAIYVVNASGVLQATFLQGNFTAGVPYAASNNYMHVVRGNPPAGAPYVTGVADHLVYEFGVLPLVDVTGFGSGIGSRPAVYPSVNAVPFHVSGFNNVGNPGTRTPYLETDRVGWA